MARFRMDPTTWLWVITGEAAAEFPKRAGCPFCPDAPIDSGSITAEKHDAQGNWTVRVLANRLPVLHPEGELDREGDGLFDAMNAVGAHEILVEGPAHDSTLAQLPLALLGQVLETAAERIRELKRDPRVRYVELFQNQGIFSGSQISHPHAQLLASPVLPHRVERELRAAHRHYERKERCLYCDLIRQELDEQKRVVEQTADYIAACPYASRFPYELWLLPRRHHSCFEEDITEAHRRGQMAVALHSAMSRMERVSSSFQLVLHTEPNRNLPTWLKEDWRSLSEDFHWHTEIVPRFDRREQNQPQVEEFYLNPVPPEEAARHLRSL